jgi:hypothetical protein
MYSTVPVPLSVPIIATKPASIVFKVISHQVNLIIVPFAGLSMLKKGTLFYYVPVPPG